MFERFTDTARHAIVLAQEEARALAHDWIGTEHLLLGLLRGGDPIAAGCLEGLGVDMSTARDRVDQAVGPQPSPAPPGPIPFTPRSKKILEMSLREAMRLGHNYIGPEHILLALVEEGSGIAPQVLLSLGATPDEVRARVLTAIREAPGPHHHPEPDLHQRISTLEHRITALERQLGLTPGATALEARVADLERRLTPDPNADGDHTA
ncbi:hypothetical protein D7D52_22810 [Nocardia yunnanensis]|uniref:Clp R domain-containing protein n=1 Tax=Nocardia yunnanensis TaxID=2382165 RepID=A0A386ZFH9_9NOCA|nr:Clp protease N-terminal domain-containing protein [Nocardia yunnanensis]AYF76196.1 hypothetical protein D7D52_22810 [Nocardia yunnanensis]